WYLDVYPSRATAEAAKGLRGTVVESFGQVWLLSIEQANWAPSGGERVAEIGPLPVTAGANYSAQYMEAIFMPGMTAPAQTHGGPEAWYTLGGRDLPRNPAWHANRARRRPTRDRARRPTHAPYSHRHRAAPITCAHSA